MKKYEIIETCLKCGYKWIRQVCKPKRCPSCRSICWNKIPTKKVTKEALKIEILPGQVKTYKFDKRTKRAITRAVKNNHWLVAEVRGDVVMVRNNRP